MWFNIKYSFYVTVFDIKHLLIKKEKDDEYLKNYIEFAQLWKLKRSEIYG